MMAQKRRFKVATDSDLCKGCGICVDFCPKKVFVASNQINQRGYYQPVVANNNDCVGCKLCELLCPDIAIIITEVSDEAAQSL